MAGHREGGFSSRNGGSVGRAGEEKPSPRAALRIAQQVAVGAALRAQQAAEIAARGRAAVDAAQAALAVHDGLDAEVAGHHAALLRAGGMAGRAALPPNLAAARRQKADAAEDLADAAAAALLLDIECASAEATAGRAAEAVRLALDGVMQEVAAELLTTMRAAETEAGRLRVSLTGLVNSRTSADPPLAWPVQQVAHDPAHELLLGRTGQDWSVGGAAWTRFRAGLAANPDAAFEA